MKKLFLTFVMCLALFCAGPVFAEGTKVMVDFGNNLAPIVVPEKAPDIFKLEGEPAGMPIELDKKHSILPVMVQDKEVLVQAIVLVLLRPENEGKPIVVGMMVLYTRSGVIEYIEDVAFKKTGKPSGVLERVKEPMTTAEVMSHFRKGTEI